MQSIDSKLGPTAKLVLMHAVPFKKNGEQFKTIRKDLILNTTYHLRSHTCPHTDFFNNCVVYDTKNIINW